MENFLLARFFILAKFSHFEWSSFRGADQVEAVIKTDGWQGYSFLDASPSLQHEWLVPGSGKQAPKVLPWVHTLIANIKGNKRGIHHGVSPKHLPRYLAGC
jgi:hypothetical protein